MISIRRRCLHVYYLGALLTFALYAFWSAQYRQCYICFTATQPEYSSSSPIPELDHIPAFVDTGPNAEFCRRRFTLDYLEELRDHSIQYCEKGEDNNDPAQSQLTCFHAHVRDDGGVDSMCIGTGATWNPTDRQFMLQCPHLHQPTQNETERGLIPFNAISGSWYDTGPARVFAGFVSLTGKAEDPKEQVPAEQQQQQQQQQPVRNVILVKREGGHNLWHSLMEIQSMMSTIDVLRMARPDDSLRPFFVHPEDDVNTHVVVLDNHAQGPTFDLWRFFSPNPIITLGTDETNSLADQFPFRREDGPFNIIVPMAGGSNPTWQNDWVDRMDCTEAPLVKLLAQRVFQHYNIVREEAPSSLQDDYPLTITFIDRKGSRQLIGHEVLLHRLEERYPNAVVHAVDLATLSLADQLRTVQATDILVGVHGAGLTHTMFMRAYHGAVVEIQPEGMGHKGFANMAAMTGHAYFMAEAEIVLPEEVADFGADGAAREKQGTLRGDRSRPWQSSHVHIGVEPFLDIMERAVETVVRKAKETGR